MQGIHITGIHHWIHQLPFPTHQFCHHWQLITSQAKIGRKQLLLGRFSIIIWTHCHQLWESRNKDKHGHDSEMQKKILLEQVQRRMTVMYQLKSR
jgi:hypothetical protein